MMKKAYWKREEEALNAFNSKIVQFVDKGTIYGVLDTIPSTSKGDKQFIFITETIADIGEGDHLVIDNQSYIVNYVDNPMFSDNHLEIELFRV